MLYIFLTDVVAISIIFGVLTALVGFMIYFTVKHRRNLKSTQSKITDAELLEMIDAQVDGLMSSKAIREKTGLSKGEVNSRLHSMSMHGLLSVSYTGTMKSFYHLRSPLDRRPAPEMSPEPFLTVQDILKLFKHFNYKPSLQNLVIATRLPLKVIVREMKYFQKEGVVTSLINMTGSNGMDGIAGSRYYILQDPYRSDPDKFLARENEMNLELKKVLVKESLLV